MSRKPTIAQLRHRAAIHLAELKLFYERKTPNQTIIPTEQDIQEAKRIMNSFYRLSGLETRIHEVSNNAILYERKRKWLTHQEEKADRWRKRLNKMLEPYEAELLYSSFRPTIVEKGTTRDLYLRHYYK